jgi:hypothetical protein
VDADGKNIAVPLRIKVDGTGDFEHHSMPMSEINHSYEITDFMESYVHEHDEAYFTVGIYL